MGIKLYYMPRSTPSRSVLLAAKLIGVNLDLKHIDLSKREHLTPEFLQLNPQHKVPVIDDNGFILSESQAIMVYLFNKFGKDDSLYPKDPQKRAIVDQRMCFNSQTLHQKLISYCFPVIFAGVQPDERKFKKAIEALGYLEKYLEGSKFSAGNTLTLADAALVPTVSTLELFDDISKFQRVCKWMELCKEVIPDHENLDSKGAQDFKEFFESARAKIQP